MRFGCLVSVWVELLFWVELELRGNGYLAGMFPRYKETLSILIPLMF